jgi:hypothetical protein
VFARDKGMSNNMMSSLITRLELKFKANSPSPFNGLKFILSRLETTFALSQGLNPWRVIATGARLPMNCLHTKMKVNLLFF